MHRTFSTIRGAAMCALGIVAACTAPPPSGTSSSPAPGASARSIPPASVFVPLRGNLHPLASAAFDAGRVNPGRTLTGVSLLFRMSPAQQARSRVVLADLQDPLSPGYHRWLTPEKYAAWFGAGAADIAHASAWLRGQGFTVHGPSPTATRLFFSGTVGQLEAAFRTEVHHYDVRGERHFALAAEPSAPPEIAAAVLGLRGVHDFRLPPASPSLTTRGARPPAPDFALQEDAGTAPVLTLAPADFAAIYDLAPLYANNITGNGQKIAIVGESDFNDADILAFRQTFGLRTDLMPTRHFVSYSGNPRFSPDTFGEAELDLEWAGAVAKEASIHYIFTGDNPAYNVWDAIVYAIEDGTYPILSASYSGCEFQATPNEQIYLETMGDAAAMEGVTVVNSAGDWGAAGCDYAVTKPLAAQGGVVAPWPATIPSFVSVGGTELAWGDKIPEPSITPSVAAATPFATYWGCSQTQPMTCTAKGAVPEVGWNEIDWEIAHNGYFWGASGGGSSQVFPKPPWQIGQTLPGPYRQVPDVALSAAWSQVGYIVSTSWTAADGDAAPPQAEELTPSGGTSAAAPSFAGILALLNQALAAQDPGAPAGLGNANPVLYAISASTRGTSSAAFRDVTSGNNVVPCQQGTVDCPSQPPYQYGYQAGPGYDMVTGLGSVDAHNLVAAWTGLTPTRTSLQVMPSGAAEGAPVHLAATVASNATSNAMTGSVLFYFDTLDDGGSPDLSLMATAAIAPTTSGSEGGTATAVAIAPPGFLGKARVVAFYGGDSHYLASWSQAATVATTSTLAASPPAITLQPNEQHTFTTSGGVAPVQWTIVRDTACDAKYNCSGVEALTATSGAFQAGPVDGTTLVAAIDADGAESRITVTVSGSPIDGGTLPPAWDGGGWDGGAADTGTGDDGPADAPPGDDGGAGTSDASIPADAAVEDGSASDAAAATDASLADAGSSDSGEAADAHGSGAGGGSDGGAGGCGCAVVGRESGDGTGGALGSLMLALVAAARVTSSRSRNRGCDRRCSTR